MSTPTGMPSARTASLLRLTAPRHLAVYDSYEDAQHAVDYLSDHGFAVQNVLIVGTDLRQVERITGRMSLGRAVVAGAASGLWLGLMVGFLMSMFAQGDTAAKVSSAVVAGGVFGAVWGAIRYSLTQGRRDFTSVAQVVATRYEILVEQDRFAEANAILRPAPETPRDDGPATEPR